MPAGYVYTRNPFLRPQVQASAELHAAVNTLTNRISTRAKALAPFRTGDLKDSIGPSMIGPAVGQVLADIRYAAYVEYGTGDTPSQPYMRPAADEFGLG
jgi:HK97 gp10 family phage protein